MEYGKMSLNALVTMRDWLKRGHTMTNVRLVDNGCVRFDEGITKYIIRPNGDIEVLVSSWVRHLTRSDIRIPPESER